MGSQRVKHDWVTFTLHSTWGPFLLFSWKDRNIFYLISVAFALPQSWVSKSNWQFIWLNRVLGPSLAKLAPGTDPSQPTRAQIPSHTCTSNQMGNVSKAITTDTKSAKAWGLFPSWKWELILVIMITTPLSAAVLTRAEGRLWGRDWDLTSLGQRGAGLCWCPGETASRNRGDYNFLILLEPQRPSPSDTQLWMREVSETQLFCSPTWGWSRLGRCPAWICDGLVGVGVWADGMLPVNSRARWDTHGRECAALRSSQAAQACTVWVQDIPGLGAMGLAAGPPLVHHSRESSWHTLQSLPDGLCPSLARMGGKGVMARISFPAEVLLDMFLHFYQE